MDQRGNILKHGLKQANKGSPRRTRRGVSSLGLKALRDPDPQVRVRAIGALDDLQDDCTVDALLDLAQDDPVLRVRCAAFQGLGDFVLTAWIYLGEPDPDTDPDTIHAGYRLPSKVGQVYRFLLAACRDANRPLEERCCAVEALSYFYNHTVQDTIANLYARPERQARMSALRAMGHNGSSRWADIVQRALGDHDLGFRLAAISAAGEMGLASAGPALLRLTYSEDREERLAALRALGETGWHGAFERLDEMAVDEDPGVRRAAEQALEEWLFFNRHDAEG